ncbi:MAG: rod shape-determining protein MreC [Anaerolineae bacterium]
MRRESGQWLPWVLLVVALLFLILIEAGTFSPLESLLGQIIAPVARGVSSILDTLGDLGQTAQDVQQLQEEVEALQSANDTLIQENFRLREFKAENEELRRILNFAQENPTYGYIGADVVERGCDTYPCGTLVGEDTNPYLQYLIINTGTRQGVAVGMPVVTSGAVLVGRVARVSPNLAYIQLINDPQSQIAAMLQETRVTGMVIGTIEGGLRMVDILPDEEVAGGETVITSAAGGLLPRGLILGQVESVSYLESDLFQRAVIRPAIDFKRLEMVLVITDFEHVDLQELEEE